MNKTTPDPFDQMLMASPASFPVLKKWVFRTAIIVAVFIVMSGFLPRLLPLSMSTYVVEKWLEYMTDKIVTVAGNAEFTLLPTLSVSATNVKFSNVNADVDNAGGLIDVEAMNFEITSIPLLAGELEFIQLKLDRPRYRYVSKAFTTTEMRDVGSNDKLKRTQNWGWWRKFSLGSVDIKNAYIEYIGDSNSDGLQIAEINLSNNQLSNNQKQAEIKGQAVISGHPVEITINVEKVVAAGTGAGVPFVVGVKNNDVDMNIAGMFSVRQNLNGEGTISIQSKNIKSVAQLFSVDVLNNFTGAVSFQSGYTFNDERFLMNNISVMIGAMKISGDIDTSKTSDRVVGTFNADDLDVDIDDGAYSKSKAYIGLLKFAKQTLKSWGVGSDVSLNWTGLTIADLKLGSGNLKVFRTEKPERLVFDVKNLKTYSGIATAKLSFGAGEAMYALKGEISVQRFNVGALIKDYAGSTALNGQANLSLKLLSVGASPEQLLSSLTGSGSFNVTDGRVNDDAIAEYLLAKTSTSERGSTELIFSQFLGDISFSQGVARSQDLLLKAQSLSLIGEGELDLTNKQIDISLQSLSSPSGTKLRTVKPFRIGGTLSTPVFQEQ